MFGEKTNIAKSSLYFLSLKKNEGKGFALRMREEVRGGERKRREKE